MNLKQRVILDLALCAFIGTLFVAPWEMTYNSKFSHNTTSPLWSIPSNVRGDNLRARLRLEVLAVEWIALAVVAGVLIVQCRKPARPLENTIQLASQQN